ncbi:MAG: methyltransferase domain-containing protein [Dehalococcoidia bacterium]
MTGDRSVNERWSSGADYEAFVGRWSRLVVREFIDWLAAGPDLDWLDVGCGTGGLSQTILSSQQPASVRGVDRSPDYVRFVSDQIRDPRATFDVGDAQAIDAGDGAYDAVVSGLVLNFVAEPAKALSEFSRVLRPGGIAGVYVWDYAGEMQMLRRFWDAAVALDPEAAALDEGRRFGVCRPEGLMQLFGAAGLRDVETRPIDVWTEWPDFDSFWRPFLGAQGSAPTYVASLGEPARDALRERLRADVPLEPDGSVRMLARAWAVKGRAL